MLNSYYNKLTPVKLPYKGRQNYMHEFEASNPAMPKGFEDYLNPVKDLLSACGKQAGPVYMTVDEKVVKSGTSQRRPGPHVDGHFIKNAEAPHWGHGGWNHTCNNVPIPRMNIIVASSFPACKAWAGEFDGEPKNDGDLSHLNLGEGEILEANTGYLLSPDCVHESMPMEQDTERTFLRLAFI